MRSILNQHNVDYLAQPLFLGEDLSLQRYDKFKYPVFFDLYKKQLELLNHPYQVIRNIGYGRTQESIYHIDQLIASQNRL